MNAKQMQEFANRQVDANNEMLHSLRIHHGERLADIAVGLLNNIAIAQQLSLAFAAVAVTVEDDKIRSQANDIINTMMRRCEDNTASLFSTVLTEEEAEILQPFMVHATNNCNTIVEQALSNIN